MKRILRVTCLIFGTVLLLMSGAFFYTRDMDSDVPPPAVVTYFPSDNTRQFAILGPSSYFRSISPPDHFMSEQQKVVGRWFYYVGLDAGNTSTKNFYRVNLINPEPSAPELVNPMDASTPSWSVDGEWLFTIEIRQGQRELVVQRNNHSGRVNLTTELDANVIAVPSEAFDISFKQDDSVPQIFGPEQGWVYFQSDTILQPGNVLKTSIYRVKIDGTELQNLAPNLDESVSFAHMQPGSDWIVVQLRESGLGSSRLWWYEVRRDGSEIRPVFGDRDLAQLSFTPTPSSETRHLSYQAWIPEKKLALWYLIQGDAITLIGMQPAANLPIWQIPVSRYLQYESSTPDGEWLLFSQPSDETWLWIRSDNGVQQPFAAEVPLTEFWTWTVDQKWMIFLSTNEVMQTQELIFVNPDGRLGRSVPLPSGNNEWLQFAAWSPNMDWLVFLSHQNERTRIYALRFDDARIYDMTKHAPVNNYRIASWIENIDLQWQPYLILMMAVGLIIVALSRIVT